MSQLSDRVASESHKGDSMRLGVKPVLGDRDFARHFADDDYETRIIVENLLGLGQRGGI